MTTAGYDFQFANAHHLLVDSTRLAALKTIVDDIAADLATLDGQTEGQREADAPFRAALLTKFQRMAEV